MQDTINGLLAALGILIVTQITQFVRSINNRKRIRGIEADSEQTREDARRFREQVEHEREALVNRVARESMDRIDRLITTSEREREEHKIERNEWREDRNEWKQERTERDERDRLLKDQVESLTRELEAVRRELEAVHSESSERETVIKEQSKIIDEQAKTISRHEKTITQQAERISALEAQVKELEKLRVETLKAMPALPPAPSAELIAAKRGTNEVKVVKDDVKPPGDAA